MTLPLRWAPGFRCAVVRDGTVIVGSIERAPCRHGLVLVRVAHDNALIAAHVRDLDLVPLALARHERRAP